MINNKHTMWVVLTVLTSVMVVACKPAPQTQDAIAKAVDSVPATAKAAATEVANAERPATAPGGMAAGAMGMGAMGGGSAFPPPRSTDGSRAAGTPAGTSAPDGVGVTMRAGASPLPYTEDTVTYVPWEEGSKSEPLPAGSKLPAGSVAWTEEGAEFDLNNSVQDKPTMLIYYRGGWCPYCNAHLREIQGSVPALEAMGYQILAVSTDTVEALKTYDESEYTYQILADPDLALATSLGLKYKVVKEYIEHVKAIPADRAFDMEERNGGYLVTPAAFILDTAGTIRFTYANDNYTVRASQESLLNAAKAALQ